jgi:transposase
MISPETVLEIRRLHDVEEWPVGTIASHLGLHHSTIEAALARIPTSRRTRCSKVDPYLDFLERQLEQNPRLRVTRLYWMVKKRGYDGSVIQLRRAVRKLRPKVATRVFHRLRFAPGEQAQVDWGSFGQVRVGRADRPLSALVVRLSHSRWTHVEFFFDQKLETLLRGLSRALTAFGGTPRELIFDNMKTVVVDRRGRDIRFHPRLIELAIHYRFQPIACWPYHPQAKGGVERAIRELRESFFSNHSFTTLPGLNRAVHRWLEEEVHARPHPTDRSRTVAEVYADEVEHLTRLPERDFAVDLVKPVSTRKMMAVRFDRNDYTVPPSVVGKQLTLVASDRLVRILDGEREVARHERCYSAGEWIEDPAHRQALLDQRRSARAATNTPLERAIPAVRALLDDAFRQGGHLATEARQLGQLLDDYGADELARAVDIAVAKNTPHASSVAYILEQRRRVGRRKPRQPVDFGRRPELGDYHVPPPALERYDALASTDQEDPDDDES